MNWNRYYAGHYVATHICENMLTRDGQMFLPIHLTVRKGEDGKWDATYQRGDDALKFLWNRSADVTSLGTYPTMREAKHVLMREILWLDKQSMNPVKTLASS